jgi:hypothetical protein
MRAAVPVLSHADADSSSELELLFRRDRPLADPYLATIELTAHSRVDIPSDVFDGGTPIQLGLGARVVEVLPVTSRPETVPKPKIVASADGVHVGPSLIGKRQQVTITVLTDGEPHLICKSPLANVRVRKRSYEVDPHAMPRLVVEVAVVSLATAIIITAALLTQHGVGNGGSPGQQPHLLPYYRPIPPSTSGGTRSASAP